MEEDVLRRKERCMAQKMCGVKFADRINTRELMERLELKDTIIETDKQGSLRLLGHVLRKGDDKCVNRHGGLWSLEVEGS